MAYIVGSFVGKTPLSSISPKKTWEGTIGGSNTCSCHYVSYGLFHRQTFGKTYGHYCCTCHISGTYGDLFESKLKRLAGVKDSGKHYARPWRFFRSLRLPSFCSNSCLVLCCDFYVDRLQNFYLASLASHTSSFGNSIHQSSRPLILLVKSHKKARQKNSIHR